MNDVIDRQCQLKQRARLLAAMIEIVRGARENAEEMVVAALERAVVRQKSEMPFADEGRAVAGFLEQRRKGRVAGRQAHAFRCGLIAWLFAADRATHLTSAGA